MLKFKSDALYGIVIVFLLTAAKVDAQDASQFLPDIVPPPPTTYALGNYGNEPIGMVTGTPNLSIPIVQYKGKKLSLPVSLFYGSGGVKVDDVSSTVGLGWGMNAGGMITRSVNDIADEKNHLGESSIPPDSGMSDGTQLTPTEINYLYAIGNTAAYDSEADVFSYNFNGISGKFVLDTSGNPVRTENMDVQIEKITTLDVQSFIITTNDGVKYYFRQTEFNSFRVRNAGSSPASGNASGWYLTKIVHPEGEELYLEYEANNYRFTASQSQSFIVSDPYMQTNCAGLNPYQYGPVLTGLVSHVMTVTGKRLKRVYSNNSLFGELSVLPI